MGAVTAEGAFAMVLRQIARHPQEPGARVQDRLAMLPLFPEAHKRLLGNVHGDIGAQPARVHQGPHLPAVALVNGIKFRMARRRCFRA